MPHRITIESSRHQFDVEPGNTLLRAALDAGINLPYGCRNGACGACKGRVVSGQIDRGDYRFLVDPASGHWEELDRLQRAREEAAAQAIAAQRARDRSARGEAPDEDDSSGVMEHGLFLGLARVVIVGEDRGARGMEL